ncbi:hypothetical protein EN780_03245 [Mesorhizobium sp. M4B.F.Ca.ET.089.01.1.1]|uniref:hypothetical protein n=1 Tax=Mesorhizobium sp. M4B.F.Ca.ET.089.01.1.1 TaxID=2496662 RepID=UPI000FE3BAE7|nr:hypothetical protein [Mesorhizobium sp. M4B.F.Ca.ET.089.01.1.1]RWX70423.1 hypothetical protein EN780_03245 [Mesorhizobium sp. M4B.F.Ca.ET.089.01.1.1]
MNFFGKSLFGKTVFAKIMNREIGNTLGNPLGEGSGAFRARKATLAAMTGGKGFRTPAKQPRVYSDGLTRGQRKRMRRDICIVKEARRQKEACEKMSERSAIPFDALKFQFGCLAR